MGKCQKLLDRASAYARRENNPVRRKVLDSDDEPEAQVPEAKWIGDYLTCNLGWQRCDSAGFPGTIHAAKRQDML